MAANGGSGSFVDLLDDDVADYSLADWRRRNLVFYERIVDRGLFEPRMVPFEAHRYLVDTLIRVRVGAATDPQNAGHVRAQNENVVHYAIAADVDAETLAVSLSAGFIHDLNKALGEPLRSDEFAVRDGAGRIVTSMTTMAQIVGLNHLGERTRRALNAATRLRDGPIAPEVADRIDRCIIHHGLGSSRFIQELIDGKNEWWGDEFVDAETGKRKLVHPEQPPLTLESVIHDLADSTQQMQGGAAWLMKYPAGFWRASQRSYFDMLTDTTVPDEGGIAMSLAGQIEVETQTCHAIVDRALAEGVVDEALAARLRGAVGTAIESSVRWHGCADLASDEGESVYHDVAAVLGITREEALERLRAATPGTPEGDAIEDVIWDSGRKLDRQRARDLAHRIDAS
ncbi:MAG: hypothetical protein RMA76_28610 [Deltaproteobacteria bacterium]|jgi:hypothetical protein